MTGLVVAVDSRQLVGEYDKDDTGDPETSDTCRSVVADSVQSPDSLDVFAASEWSSVADAGRVGFAQDAE